VKAKKLEVLTADEQEVRTDAETLVKKGIQTDQKLS